MSNNSNQKPNLPVTSSSKGVVVVRRTVTPRDKTRTKEENQAEAVVETSVAEVPPQDVSRGAGRVGRGIGKWAIRLGFTKKFQTVQIEGGIELPVLMDLDDPVGSGERAMDLAEEIVARKMVSQLDEAEAVLESIIRRVSNGG
jgi:hypothetical protein